jgi:hypothetical protein
MIAMSGAVRPTQAKSGFGIIGQPPEVQIEGNLSPSAEP